VSLDSLASLPSLQVAGRLSRLRLRIEDEQLDSLLVVELANIRYLTGFTGSAALLLVSGDSAHLATDGRYRTQAAEQLEAARVADDVQLVIGRIPAQREAIVASAQASASSIGGRIGLEADHVAWAEQIRWAELFAPSVPVPTSGLVESLRAVKDDSEVARIEAAAAIADAALSDVVPMLEKGSTESELAIALDVAMRRHGAEDRAFETIVASGPNSAKPHARPGERRISEGDPVVIDFGAVVDGYRSDMTRTFFAGGTPTPEMLAVYQAVLESQAAGVRAVSPGVATSDVDEVCRKSLTDAGLGEAFEHGTGHGVGLDIHEAPWVGPGSAGILSPGAVVTVEPGAYLAGLGGVRIEDTVVVTDGGCRALTSFHKNFAVS